MIKAEQLQLSLQSVVSNVYKGLRAQQNELHIRMTDVKSSVSLAPLSTTELATALSIAIQSLLAGQGWSQLDRQHMVDSTLWDLDASRQQACHSVKLSVACQAPANAVVCVNTGMNEILLVI